jgi:hypothetical protein
MTEDLHPRLRELLDSLPPDTSIKLDIRDAPLVERLCSLLSLQLAADVNMAIAICDSDLKLAIPINATDMLVLDMAKRGDEGYCCMLPSVVTPAGLIFPEGASLDDFDADLLEYIAVGAGSYPVKFPQPGDELETLLEVCVDFLSRHSIPTAGVDPGAREAYARQLEDFNLLFATPDARFVNRMREILGLQLPSTNNVAVLRCKHNKRCPLFAVVVPNGDDPLMMAVGWGKNSTQTEKWFAVHSPPSVSGDPPSQQSALLNAFEDLVKRRMIVEL